MSVHWSVRSYLRPSVHKNFFHLNEIWHVIGLVSVCPIGILTLTHQGAACNVVSATIRRVGILTVQSLVNTEVTFTVVLCE